MNINIIANDPLEIVRVIILLLGQQFLWGEHDRDLEVELSWDRARKLATFISDDG